MVEGVDTNKGRIVMTVQWLMRGSIPRRNTMGKYNTYQTYRNALATMSHMDLIDYTAGLLVELQKHGIVPDKKNPKRLDFTKCEKK